MPKGGFLSGLGRMLGNIGQNVPMAQAALAGDYGAMMQMRQAQQRAAQAQAEAQREIDARNNQIASGKHLGYSGAELGLLSAADLSTNYRNRIDPYSLAQGTRRVVPGQGDRPDQIMENPDAFTQTLIRAGIDPASPQAQALYRQSAQNQAGSPYQAVAIPADGQLGIINRFTGTEVGQGGGQPSPQTSDVPTVRSAADYERLPPGAPYRDPDGNLRTKGGAASQGQTPFADSGGRHRRTMMAESGGRDFAPNGSPLTSSAGARYSMQVMPDTAGDPGFGIRPAAHSGPAEYNRVGRQYIDAMTREFGSEAAGAAAYNYGPGNMRSLMRRHPNDWRSRLPAETRDYLRRQGL